MDSLYAEDDDGPFRYDVKQNGTALYKDFLSSWLFSNFFLSVSIQRALSLSLCRPFNPPIKDWFGLHNPNYLEVEREGFNGWENLRDFVNRFLQGQEIIHIHVKGSNYLWLGPTQVIDYIWVQPHMSTNIGPNQLIVGFFNLDPNPLTSLRCEWDLKDPYSYLDPNWQYFLVIWV